MKAKPAQTVHAENPGSIYLFHGDEFLVKERVQDLINKVLSPEMRDINLVVLDGVNLDVSYLSAQLLTPSLFGGPRVVLVEQTTLFSGQRDQRKLVARILDSWSTGDRKTAFKALGQALNLGGIGATELERGSEWTEELLPNTTNSSDRETLARVAQAFLEDGRKIESKGEEAVIEELILSRFPEGTILILTAGTVDRRKKIFKAIEKQGRVVECSAQHDKQGVALDRPFFENRVRETLHRSGKTIAARALDSVYQRSGTDLRQLDSELSKLSAYVGARKEVTVKDVEAVFEDFHESAYFGFSNALRTADMSKCLPALHENLKIVSHPLQTLAAIANEVRKLLCAHELLDTVLRPYWKPGISSQKFIPVLRKVLAENPNLKQKGKFNLLAINEYALYYILNDTRNFSVERLLAGMDAILDADILMKSSRLGDRAAEVILEKVVFELCKPN
jgi:DNA polymerase III subunit delta